MYRFKACDVPADTLISGYFCHLLIFRPENSLKLQSTSDMAKTNFCKGN